MDFKYYANSSYNTNLFYATTVITNADGSLSKISSTLPTGQPTRYTSVEYFPINLGWSGSLPDPWGSTTLNVQANYNIATVGSLSQLAYSAGQASVHHQRA